MWEYNENKKAYINGNQVLKFYKSLTIKQSKNSRLRNSSDTIYRLYVETYIINNDGIGGDSTVLLEKVIKGESLESQQKLQKHEVKIKDFALDKYGINNIIWSR